jgi:hypothetical protein
MGERNNADMRKLNAVNNDLKCHQNLSAELSFLPFCFCLFELVVIVRYILLNQEYQVISRVA